ncbi:hypothetical protein [Streptomyces sp. NBC_00083]|uniref:hypothetical protein n=1 Tax=Streptomyces sp. NBC_00083 TaxID=2975647 RepID=UPI00225897E4|nr:hypothetical protein [Streptomyces sp. NBC_00083]MCX5382221.1 hypothetical protein [Streptomyces sp. NBC_00083]
MNIVFPYPTLGGEVTFEVTGARLDGRPLPLGMLSREQRVVALHEAELSDWGEARLSVEAKLPERDLAEGPWTDVVCVAILSEAATNARTVGRLDPVGEGVWRGSVTLIKDEHHTRAALSVSVVATVDGEAGRLIGTAEDPWSVELNEREPTRKQELNIQEVDFREGPHEWLRPFKDAPWLVETTGDMPTVHLNTGFEGLSEFLNGGGGALDRAMRGMLAAQIATEAWIAMFHAAVGDVEPGDDGVPQWPTGWKDGVLRSMLPDVLPELSPADALLEIHLRRSEGGWQDLQPRIQYAAGRRSRVARNVGTGIRALSRTGEGTQG